MLPTSPQDLSVWVSEGCYPLVFGAAQAFHRDIYRIFGPLLPDHGSEDMPIGMRALALDGVFFLPEPLVLYRRHSDNLAGYVENRESLSQAVFEENQRHRRRADFLEQVLEDFKHTAFVEKWGEASMRRAERAVRMEWRKKSVLSAWMVAGDGPLAAGTLRMAWAWPPIAGVGCRLLLRTLFPWLQRALFAYRNIRWKAAYGKRTGA